MEYSINTIIDNEQGIEILNTAGVESFAVFYLLESLAIGERMKVTVDGIADELNMTKEQTEEAIYRLGLCQFGIDE